MLTIHLCYVLHSKILGRSLCHINFICEYLCRRDTAIVFMGPDCQTVQILGLTLNYLTFSPSATNLQHLKKWCGSGQITLALIELAHLNFATLLTVLQPQLSY